MPQTRFTSLDMFYMQRALQLARRGQFTARPNPQVGCVIADETGVLAEGYHAYFGGDHAEVAALKQIDFQAVGATAYVTLEPCSHFGKTPPCVDALIRSGVKRVVVASVDPNPKVCGQGLAKLRAHGIQTDVGLWALQAMSLNRAFFQVHQQARPYVVMKSAMSLDGRTSMASGESRWITGPKARETVHRLRAQSDAVITGIETVLADAPALTVRLDEITQTPHFKQPMRIILDSRLRIPLDAPLFEHDAPVLIVTCEADAGKIGALEKKGAQVLVLDSDRQVPLADLMTWCHEQGMIQVMVESGPTLQAAFLAADLVDDWHVFIAPKLMGSSARPLCQLPLETMAQSHQLVMTASSPVGDDLHCIFKSQKRKTCLPA